MLQKLATIGKACREQDPITSYVSQLSDNVTKWYAIDLAGPNDPAPRFSVGDRYIDQPRMFLYKHKKGNFKTSPGPSILLSGSPPKEKRGISVEDDVERLDKLIRFFEGTPLEQTLGQSRDALAEQLLATPKEERKMSLLTVRLDGKFPYDVPFIRDRFLRNMEGPSDQKGASAVCCICNARCPPEPKIDIVLKCATLDKLGFVPDMSEKNLWKAYSLCPECFTDLSRGRQVIEKSLSFSIPGNLTLWIIPEVGEERVKKVIENILARAVEEKLDFKKFAQAERLIQRILAEQQAHYDFVFIQKSQNAEKIVLQVTEVSPTRLSLLARSAAAVQEEKPFSWTYSPGIGTLFWLFGKPGKKFKGYKPFLEAVGAVYTGDRIDSSVLHGYIMQRLRGELYESKSWDDFCRSIWTAGATYLYLMLIGVIRGETAMEPSHTSILNEEWKKALFFEGVMTGALLEHQRGRKESGNMPFLKKLRGLRMEQKDFLGLMPELVLKFHQYREYDDDVAGLHEKASQAFLNAGDWRASIDEMNFVFTLGMGLYRTYYFKKED